MNKMNLKLLFIYSFTILFFQNCSENPTSFGNNPIATSNFISGTVIDSSNSLPITGVAINVIGLEKTVYTDTAGYFSISNIPVGNHQLSFDKNNYNPDTLSIAISELDSIRIDLKLSIVDPFLDIEGNIYKISFSHLNNNAFDIGIINSNGSGFRELTSNLNIFEIAPWSLDGSLFAFSKDRNIFTMDSSGENIQNITNDIYNEQTVSWSPDGAKLVFLSDEWGSYNICTINKDGTDRKRLTYNPAGLHVSLLPLWSPTGDYIAFLQYDNGKCEVNIIKPDGSNNIPLTSDSVSKYIVKWSPAGDKLLINIGKDDESEIYIVYKNVNSPLRLTNNNWEDVATDWSADASKILFYSDRDGTKDIFIMDSDGSNQKNLSNTYNSAELWGKFSPDGKKMVFWSNRDNDGEIYLMNLTGTRQIRLTYNPGADQWPTWCPVPLNESNF